MLQNVLEIEAEIPDERREHRLPGIDHLCIQPTAVHGIKSAFEGYKAAVNRFTRAANEFKESSQSQGASAEAGEIDRQINDVLSRVVHYRSKYEDVLSHTSSWHPGQGSQGGSRPGSRAGSPARTTNSEQDRIRKIDNNTCT